MGLFDMIRGEFVDIIEWLDDTRTTLAWRFPRYDNEIKNGAELIVREGQQAVFVYRGALADKFGPGHYTLTTENMPIMSTLQGWRHGFNSPFRSEVYFINTRPVTDLRWGTPQPVTVRDPDFRMVQIRANGTANVRVTDIEVFLRQMIGTNGEVDADVLSEQLRGNVTLAFSDMVLASGLGAIDLQGRQVELSDKLREFVGQRLSGFGIGVEGVTMSISLPEEIQQAMTRGVARGVEAAWLHEQRRPQPLPADAGRRRHARRRPEPRWRNGSRHAGRHGCRARRPDGRSHAGQLRPAAATAAARPAAGPAADARPAAVPLRQRRSGRGPLPDRPTAPVRFGGPAHPRHQRLGRRHGRSWAPASTVPALQTLFAAPPPLPGTPPPLPPQ